MESKHEEEDYEQDYNDSPIVSEAPYVEEYDEYAHIPHVEKMFYKISIPLLVVVGVLVFLALVVAVTRRRFFQQHTVSVYLASFAIAFIALMLIRDGAFWMALLTRRNPSSASLFFCKTWPFFDTVCNSFVNWLVVFALIDRYLTATKSPPRPAFCSMFGAKLTTGIVFAVCLAVGVPYLFLFVQRSWDGRIICYKWYHDFAAVGIFLAVFENIVIKGLFNFVPRVIALIMCFVVGCSRRSPGFQSVDEQDDLTEQKMSRGTVVIAAVHSVAGLLYVLFDFMTEMLGLDIYMYNVYLIHFDFLAVIIAVVVVFVMVPALRREVKDTCCTDAQKTSDTEKQKILMSSVAKDKH